MITDALANRINGLKALLLDMDGTLYVGARAMTGAQAFIEALKMRQILIWCSQITRHERKRSTNKDSQRWACPQRLTKF